MSNEKISMTIDRRWYRIRVHRQTLYALDRPKYIRLLINPEKKAIAIQGLSTPDSSSLPVNWKSIEAGKECMVVYSADLVEKLYILNPSWLSDKAYTISGGNLSKKERLAEFLMENAEATTGDAYE